jgi:glycosyltransferase involved in cell wall biosynthesis
MEKLVDQYSGNSVEILSFSDNRRRTIGEKRQGLLNLARGKYIAFCDDDDDVADCYIDRLLDAAQSCAHVLTFHQNARWNGQESLVKFSIQHTDEPFQPGGVTLRFPWHVCAWRQDVARSAVYPSTNWGEDAIWVEQLRGMRLTEAHIPEVLHYYDHEDNRSLAFDAVAKI